MIYKIDANKCVSCGACSGVCPAMAISAAAGKYQIDPNKCMGCGVCSSVCPMTAIAPECPAPTPKPEEKKEEPSKN